MPIISMRNISISVLLFGFATMAFSAPDPAVTEEFISALTVGKTVRTDPAMKRCADSGFRRHTGLILLMLGKTPDEKIHQYMIEGITNETVLRQLEEEFAIWKSTHDPGQVAQKAFESCLEIEQLPIKLGDFGKTCFNLDHLPSFVRAAKLLGTQQGKALQAANANYGKQLQPWLIEKVVNDMYSGREPKDDYRISREIFESCINNEVAKIVSADKERKAAAKNTAQP